MHPAKPLMHSCTITGRVLRLSKTSAKVRIAQGPPCTACTCARSRSTGQDGGRVILARNPVAALPGQEVRLRFPRSFPDDPGEFARLPANGRGILTLGLCLAGLFSGAFLLQGLGPFALPDLNAALGALGGLSLAAGIAKLAMSRGERSSDLDMPEIVEISDCVGHPTSR